MQELAGEMKNEIPKKMGWKDLPWRAQRSQRFLSFESSLYVGNIEECRNSEKEEGEVYHRGHRDHRDV